MFNKENQNCKIKYLLLDFNQNQKIVFFIRLIQNRAISAPCSNSRFGEYNFNNKLCNPTFPFDKSIYLNGNTNYTYNIDPYGQVIKGKQINFDNSGYYTDVGVVSPQIFYSSMNSLINSNWVDEKTLNVIIVATYYNASIDLFLTVRFLYESFDNIFGLSFLDFQIIDLTPIQDAYISISIIFSIICIICMIIDLRVGKTNEYIQDTVVIRYKGLLNRLKIWIQSIIKYFRDNYRRPNYFETGSNIITNYNSIPKLYSILFYSDLSFILLSIYNKY